MRKEGITMTQHWADREKMRTSLASNGKWAHTLWFIAVVFAILGVIADAMNATLGLEPTSWFLLAIATFIASATMFIGWAVSWYLSTK